MHSTIEKAPEYDPHNYSRSFQTFSSDVNSDGWADIIIIEFHGERTTWLENPKEADKLWKEAVAINPTAASDHGQIYVLLKLAERQLTVTEWATDVGVGASDFNFPEDLDAYEAQLATACETLVEKNKAKAGEEQKLEDKQESFKLGIKTLAGQLAKRKDDMKAAMKDLPEPEEEEAEEPAYAATGRK